MFSHESAVCGNESGISSEENNSFFSEDFFKLPEPVSESIVL